VPDPFDILILGAGAAGLAAARQLSSCGQRICIIEARDRVGGRIYTLHEHEWPLPIELGAEFIHGRPRETWDIIHAARLAAYDVPDDHWHFHDGKLYHARDFWGRVEKILGQLDQIGSTDMSFDEFTSKYFSDNEDREAVKLARSYVEGFNAADATRISAIALRESEEDEQQIEATKLGRMADGYDGIIRWLSDGLDPAKVELRLNTVATELRWKRGGVEVMTRRASGESLGSIEAKLAIVALPLGVLKSEDITFRPELPDAKRRALDHLEMGPVVKVMCRFRRAFWEGRKVPSAADQTTLSDVVFLHGTDVPFQTWWTMLAMRVPVLAGWAGGPAAAKLSGLDARGIESAAIQSLSTLLGMNRSEVAAELESCRAHDWQHDPFSRGAYSYVAVGGGDAMKTLAQPLDDTLFFAGEHTHWDGMSAPSRARSAAAIARPANQ
jgi:monoamine oxidase